MSHEDILEFWFDELEPAQWFKKDKAIDQIIESRFAQIHLQANQGELWVWRGSARGRLAEILILDQFSRNIFRDKPQAFASDGMALILAQEAIALGEHLKLSPVEKCFLYMPYMHSESVLIHEHAIQLFSEPGLENNLDFELKHKVIIERFGRYPHRNAVLGRASTREEKAFLAEPGSSF